MKKKTLLFLKNKKGKYGPYLSGMTTRAELAEILPEGENFWVNVEKAKPEWKADYVVKFSVREQREDDVPF